MTIYDDILETFPVYKGECRVDIKAPYVKENYVMATDGHIAIRVPLASLEKQYEQRKNTPDMRIFSVPRPEHPVEVKPCNLQLDFIAQWEQDRWRKCNWCKGKGYFGPKKDDYSCDCENGKEEKVIGFDFDGRLFNVEYLIVLDDIARKLKLSRFYRISETKINQQVVWKFGEAEIALMGIKV